MPHIMIEYTDNLRCFDPALALKSINQAAIDSSLFSENDIKSRSRCLDSWLVGVGGDNCAFVHVCIAMLSGRQPEARQSLAERVRDALISVIQCMPDMQVQLSVELAEMDRSSYTKVVLNG